MRAPAAGTRARPFAANVGVGFQWQVRCRQSVDARFRQQPSNRPHRHRTHERRSVAEKPDGLGGEPGVARVADARSATLRTKRSRPVRLTGVPANFARKAASSSRASSASGGAANSSRCTSRASRPGLGELVPGADREAVVAAEDAVADAFAQLRRDVPLVLDRQVGDAAPAIEPVGRRKGVRRADVEAAPAGAAAVGLGRRRRQLRGREDRAEEEPVAELARDEHGVLALPAEPGGCGERLLHDRRRVDEHLGVPPPCAARKPASSLSLPLITSW